MNLQTIIEFIVALTSLMILHELGHFLAFRLLKVEVEELGLGIPPRAITLFEARGTKYTLNWIPFGAFVRPKGENDPSIPGGLAAAKPWARITIFLAGPIMNLLAAVLLYIVAYSGVGYLPDRNRVALLAISEGSPAEQAGLQIEDIVVRVGDEEINSFDELKGIIYANLGIPLQFFYERDGELLETTVTPLENPGEQGAVGIYMGYPFKPFTLLAAIPEGFASTYEYCRALYDMLAGLIQGRVSSEEGRLVGFKGMYDLYTSVRENEPVNGVPAQVNIAVFFASITISLGLLNLLPIPALDGGRIVLTLPELILRRRLKPEYEAWMVGVSLILLLVLILVINVQDFINPVPTPIP